MDTSEAEDVAPKGTEEDSSETGSNTQAATDAYADDERKSDNVALNYQLGTVSETEVVMIDSDSDSDTELQPELRTSGNKVVACSAEVRKKKKGNDGLLKNSATESTGDKVGGKDNVENAPDKSLSASKAHESVNISSKTVENQNQNDTLPTAECQSASSEAHTTKLVDKSHDKSLSDREAHETVKPRHRF